MAHDIFISHASADKTVADMVCATLEQQGLRCWIAPRDIQPGTDWGGAIVGAIHSSRAMVLVFSDHANASKHIPREIERAIDHEIPIIPFRIENVLPQGSLEYSLSSLHWLDALTPPVETHIKSLGQRLIAMLGAPSGHGAPVAESPERAAPAPAPVRDATVPEKASPSARATSGGLSRMAKMAAVGAVGGAGILFAVMFLRSDRGTSLDLTSDTEAKQFLEKLQGGHLAVPEVKPPAAYPASHPTATPKAAVLNEAQVTALKAVAEREASNAKPRVDLGNLYFDAERYDDAIKWYTEALKLSPTDVNVSSDLGVCFYYTNQPDKALEQFDKSLKLDPKHAKTLLNVGIVRAFGKQDLAGAIEAWQQVMKLAPDSPEGQAARKAIDSLSSAHPGVAATGQK